MQTKEERRDLVVLLDVVAEHEVLSAVHAVEPIASKLSANCEDCNGLGGSEARGIAR